MQLYPTATRCILLVLIPVKCTSTGDSMLCVYKRVGTFIPPPSVFIDGKEACSSQYESLVVEGTYYNATGTASSCDNRQLSTMTHYAGALLIRPASFPALVEVSFTKKFENGSSLFINQCGGVESFSSYKEVLTSEGMYIHTFNACNNIRIISAVNYV